MPDTLARTMLARAASRLNAQSGHSTLPSLIFLTDDARTPDPLPVLETLPRGTLVILRARDGARRRDLAHAAAHLAQRHGLLLSVAGDVELAAAIAANGVHLPQAQIAQAASIRAGQTKFLITTAAHDAQAVLRAHQAGAHAALLSPIFATQSHADRAALGVARLRSIADTSPIPLYALGGIDAANVAQLSDIPLAGIAAIGALMPD